MGTQPGTTTPPTATSTIAMARSLPLLALLVTVTGVAGQISFGGGKEVKRQEMVVKEEKVVKVLLSKPKLQTVNFASNERKKKNPTGSDRVSLADLLEGEHQLPPRVSSRFAFGGSALGRLARGAQLPVDRRVLATTSLLASAGRSLRPSSRGGLTGPCSTTSSRPSAFPVVLKTLTSPSAVLILTFPPPLNQQQQPQLLVTLVQLLLLLLLLLLQQQQLLQQHQLQPQQELQRYH